MRGACIPQFNVSVDPKSFELQVPAGTKVVDLEVEQLAWKKKLEGKLAVLDFEGTKIVVRDIAVNSRGHVFIVFTNGETAEDRAEYGRQVRARNADKAMRRSKRFTRPTWEVTDSLGLRYVPTDGSFQPFVGHPNFDEVVLADGQVLQGDWLMPKEPSQWRPRTLTLTASIDVERNPVARSYKAEFEHPTAALIPDWMSLCTIGPHNERELLNEERRTRRQFLREDGDWTALEASLREDLADILDQEAKGQTYAKSTIYFQLYEALLKTGKRQEALDFLRLAEKEPNQGHEGQIRAALKKEGL
jgi:hypothetical protein